MTQRSSKKIVLGVLAGWYPDIGDLYQGKSLETLGDETLRRLYDRIPIVNVLGRYQAITYEQKVRERYPTLFSDRPDFSFVGIDRNKLIDLATGVRSLEEVLSEKSADDFNTSSPITFDEPYTEMVKGIKTRDVTGQPRKLARGYDPRTPSARAGFSGKGARRHESGIGFE